MTYFVVARASDGLILYQGQSTQTLSEVQAAWPLDGKVAVEIPAPLEQQDHWRVVDGACVPRTMVDAVVSASAIDADSVDETVISGLPDPCEVSISGAVTAPWTTVEGGAITLTSSTAGEIRVAVRAEPTHRPWSTTIHAV